MSEPRLRGTIERRLAREELLKKHWAEFEEIVKAGFSATIKQRQRDFVDKNVRNQLNYSKTTLSGDIFCTLLRDHHRLKLIQSKRKGNITAA